MEGPPRSGPKKPADPVDERAAWRPARGFLVVALAIVALGLAYGWMSPPTAAVADATPRAPLQVAATAPTADASVPAVPAPTSSVPAAPPRAAAPPVAPQQIVRTRDPDGDQTPDLADFVNNGERPTVREVIDRLHQAGVHGGLGAFSPPGTRPPLVGLAVPEQFELPPGYVRHYQATDEGKRIEPILMFAPDARLFDAAGQPIAIPKDRVVPPELAPPGLPIRRIEIPAPTEPGRPGS